MEDYRVRSERADKLIQWRSEMKWCIHHYNLWFEPEQIVEAIRAKSVSLGNAKGDTPSRALLEAWDLIKASPHNE